MSSPAEIYADIVLHDTWFDWTDKSITADTITKKIIGEVSYWDLPEFVGMEPWEIERKILFEHGRPQFAGVSKYGKDIYRHFLALMKLMFPSTDITPALADATMFFCKGIGGGNKKILNLIGSQNSGKSASGCRIPFVCLYIDPEYSICYVANPFDNAADSTVWGDIEELWDQLVEAHPNDTGKGLSEASALFPWGRKYANRMLELVPNIPKAGRIELRNIKHVGKYKGSKTRGKDVNRGFFIVDIDEINEVENMSFLTTLSNISSQDAFQAITTQNYKDPEDMGGQITEPSGAFGGPTSLEQLDVDEDAWWHSSRSSVTLRFDGLRSPNILAGRTIYPKLFKDTERIRIIDDYGIHSPEYYSQVRSFPARNDETNSVLSRAKISASRHTDAFYSMHRVAGAASFCDPAFGGRDKAVWGCGYWGPATVTNAEGNQEETELLVFKDFFHDLSLVKDAIYNDFWIDRMKAAGIDVSWVTLGSEVSYEDQIAIQCKELNRKHGVPANCFGYDFSMRPDIVSSVNRIIGFSAVAFDYNKEPEGVFLHNIKKNSEDCCKNRCTELAFLAADYFLTKQIRGGSFIEAAVTQLSRTRYETKNGKYVAEDKRAYKARWQQVSPDRRDVLMGICAMVHMRGFRQSGFGSKSHAKSAFAQLADAGHGRSKTLKRLR